MVSKVEREEAAIEAAQKDLAERKKRLVQLRKEEAQKELASLVKKVGDERSIKLLQMAVKVKPNVALDTLEKMAQAGASNSGAA